MPKENIYDLLEFFSGYELQNQIIARMSAGKQMKSVTAVTKLYASMPCEVYYVVRHGDERTEFVNFHAALEYYLGL